MGLREEIEAVIVGLLPETKRDSVNGSLATFEQCERARDLLTHLHSLPTDEGCERLVEEVNVWVQNPRKQSQIATAHLLDRLATALSSRLTVSSEVGVDDPHAALRLQLERGQFYTTSSLGDPDPMKWRASVQFEWVGPDAHKEARAMDDALRATFAALKSPPKPQQQEGEG